MNPARDLAISTSLPISIQRASGDSNRHAGTLVGNIEQDYLIIGGLKDVQLEIGEPIIVRMVHESSVKGYQSSVQGVIDAPVRLYVISYPERVESVNLRKAERLSVFFPADVRAEVQPGAKDIVMLQGMFLNISAGGCCVSTKRQIPSSARVAVAFSLPGESHVHHARGVVLTTLAGDSVYAQRVRWIKESSDQPVMGAIGKWIEQNLSFALAPRGDSSAA
jgi:hypothetical protein